MVLTAWFWACPIVYPYWTIEKKLGPLGLTWIYFLNPVTPLVLTFQRCLYAKPSYVLNGVTVQVLPTQGYLWYTALILGVLFLSACLFIVAIAVFGRLEGNFAEEL